MSSLANSSLNNETKFSFSMNHRSIAAMSMAQAEAGGEDIHGVKGITYYYYCLLLLL
jgi:hypothetical protein